MIPPGQRVFPRYEMNSGAVQVVSNIPIFTSERTKYLSSFNEIDGVTDQPVDHGVLVHLPGRSHMITELVIPAP